MYLYDKNRNNNNNNLKKMNYCFPCALTVTL